MENNYSIGQIKFQTQKDQNHEEMVLLKGREFLMGTVDQDGFQDDNEGPIRVEKVKSFLIDQYAVSNRKFNQFIQRTGYITDAEKFGWSFVFHLLLSNEEKQKCKHVPVETPWWFVIEGANWKHPEGPSSDISDRMNHPVVHISWNDAVAYCKWAGKRLPTEMEWEYAARGGLEQKKYPWGNELTPNGKHMCNIWQGQFPNINKKEDGFIGTAPVDAFPPNGYGLYNVSGNVWEWCQNSFYTNTYQVMYPDVRKAMRGGSFLCHESYCNRYRVAARSSNTPDSSSSNLGFRCVKDI